MDEKSIDKELALLAEAGAVDPAMLPVYNCYPSEKMKVYLIGHARSKAGAAKLIRAVEGDPDYRASDVYYSARENAYFSNE